MGRYLVVANQTTGGAELERAIRTRIEAGQKQFYVVVPMVDPEDEAASWEPDDTTFATTGPPERDTPAAQDPRHRSEIRLERMLEKIESLGGQAEGEVGDSDPAAAVQTVVDREVFSEVIISTLPVGISRWLNLDLPSKIERIVDCPVTTIEADD